MDRLGHPVERYICQQLVFCKNAFKVPLAIRPAVKLFHNPRAQTGGGIIERVAESDRLRSLLMIVRTLPVVPVAGPPAELHLLLGERLTIRKVWNVRAGDIVQVSSDNMLGVFQRERGGHAGPEVAPLRA